MLTSLAPDIPDDKKARSDIQVLHRSSEGRTPSVHYDMAGSLQMLRKPTRPKRDLAKVGLPNTKLQNQKEL